MKNLAIETLKMKQNLVKQRNIECANSAYFSNFSTRAIFDPKCNLFFLKIRYKTYQTMTGSEKCIIGYCIRMINRTFLVHCLLK